MTEMGKIGVNLDGSPRTELNAGRFACAYAPQDAGREE